MRKVVIPSVAAALTVAAMIYQGLNVDPYLCEPPDTALGEIEGFRSEPLGVSEAELKALPGDTQFDKRLYTDADGVTYLTTLVIGGKSKSSIHRPELCLPSQGHQMLSPRDLTVGGVDWHLITLAHRDEPAATVAYTFFNQAGYRTSSHLKRIFRDVWDRSVLGRIDRWVMAEVFAATDDEDKVRAFLGNLKGVVK